MSNQGQQQQGLRPLKPLQHQLNTQNGQLSGQNNLGNIIQNQSVGQNQQNKNIQQQQTQNFRPPGQQLGALQRPQANMGFRTGSLPQMNDNASQQQNQQPYQQGVGRPQPRPLGLSSRSESNSLGLTQGSGQNVNGLQGLSKQQLGRPPMLQNPSLNQAQQQFQGNGFSTPQARGPPQLSPIPRPGLPKQQVSQNSLLSSQQTAMPQQQPPQKQLPFQQQPTQTSGPLLGPQRNMLTPSPRGPGAQSFRPPPMPLLPQQPQPTMNPLNLNQQQFNLSKQGQIQQQSPGLPPKAGFGTQLPPGIRPQLGAQVGLQPAPPLRGPNQGFGSAATSTGQVPSGFFQQPNLSQPQQQGSQSNQNIKALQSQLESLFLGSAQGSAPGQPAAQVDDTLLPRPLQENSWEAPFGELPYNSSYKFIRPTVHVLPASSTTRQRYPAPIGLLVTPLAQDSVKYIDPGRLGVQRCRFCRTYINPFVQWVDNGLKFRCPICTSITEVPIEYYQKRMYAAQNQGNITEGMEQPELELGTVEYTASQDYMVRPPMPPTYIFLIDVSFHAQLNGSLQTISSCIRQSLDNIQGKENAQIAFMAFDRQLYYFSFKQQNGTFQMSVVSDVEEPFIPQPEDIVINLSENREAIENLLIQIPKMFLPQQNTQISECGMGVALQAAYLLMNQIGGKLVLFLSSIPNIGQGAINPQRDSTQLYNTERESNLRNPQDQFYKKFASECSRVYITIDAFVMSQHFTDCAAISCLCKYTGGAIYMYHQFVPQKDGQKLGYELQRLLQRETGWEAVMRVRCSKGLKIKNHYGHFLKTSSDLLHLPTVNSDQTFLCEIELEESVYNESVAYFQCALLYTVSDRVRRIRVQTIQIPVSNEPLALFTKTDGPALATMLSKLAVERTMTTQLQDSRKWLINQVQQVYKRFQDIVGGQMGGMQASKLVYPQNLRLLGVYCMGFARSAALRGGPQDVSSDERCIVSYDIQASDIQRVLTFSYPSVYALHEIHLWGNDVDMGQGQEDGATASEGFKFPPRIPASMQYVDPYGLYLINNGRLMILYIGAKMEGQLLSDLFGVDRINSHQEVPQLQIQPNNSEFSLKVQQLLLKLRYSGPTFQNLFIIRQNSPMDALVYPLFVEDRQAGLPSYYEFLGAINKGVITQ